MISFETSEIVILDEGIEEDRGEKLNSNKPMDGFGERFKQFGLPVEVDKY